MLRPVTVSRARAASLLALAAAGIVAGCGSSKSGEAAKSPQAIVKDASRALAAVHSFTATGKVRISGHPGTISVAFQRPASLRFDLASAGNAKASVVLIGNAAYLNADKAFYLAQGGGGATAASLLAGRWLKLPVSTAGLSSLTGEFKLATLSHCLAVGHGTLSSGGSASVGGRDAVIVTDAGDKPGTTPGRLYVATKGAPYPLRIQSTGATRSGGVSDALCKGTSGLHDSGTNVTFTSFDRHLDISAPPKALSLSQIAGG